MTTKKLTNTQSNKLNSAAKNKTGTTLRLNKKNFEGKELPQELFLGTRETKKLRNAQISKIIQSDGYFGSWFANLVRKALTNVAIRLPRDNLLGLVSSLPLSAINKLDIKINEKGAVRA